MRERLRPVVIMGGTGSGKTTLLNELVKRGFEKVVTYTTRSPRPGEVDGVDYHFIETNEFIRKIGRLEFIETTHYVKADEGVVMYGTPNFDYKNTKKVIVLNGDGVAKLAEGLLRFDLIYLDLTDEILIDRATKRGDKLEEILRRIPADKKIMEKALKVCKPSLHIEGECPVEHIADLIEAEVWNL